MMRVKTVLALAVVAALAVAAAEPAASEDAAISPGFRIACVVTFPTPPRGRTTLVGKDREYLLRYDREEDADECPSATFSALASFQWRHQSFAPNLTPMVDALATAPQLRLFQPLPWHSHTEMFKTASTMPMATICTQFKNIFHLDRGK